MRIIAWILGIPIGLGAIILSVANRAPVTFSLDPLSLGDPAIAVEVPLFLLLFGAAFCGLVIGWLVGWSGQAQLRRELRQERRRARAEPTAPPPGQALVSRT